jgi:ribA/ribD-fused uncharacterized protein
MGGGWKGDPVADGADPHWLPERTGSLEADLSRYDQKARRTLMPTKITSFDGEYRFLSNFYPAKVTHDGIEYPTTEHAFQAAKSLHFGERWELSRLPTPGQAKRAGRQNKLRADWEQAKDQIMLELTILKFVNHRKLKEQLLATGTAELIEGNNWGDTYWGVCNGQGTNVLGKILMLVRGQLR